MKIKIITLVLIIVVVLSAFTPVFADDMGVVNSEESSEVNSDLSSEVTQEDLDLELHKLSENLAELQAVGALATTYDANDIYNLLYKYMTYGASGNGSSYIKLTFDYVSGINSKIDAMRTTLNGIYTQLGENNVTTIWDTLNDIFHALTKQIALDGEIVDVTASDLLLMIDNNIDTVNDSLNTIMLSLAQLQGLATNIANTSLNIATNTANTVSAINDLKDSYNNIEWLTISGAYLGAKHNYSDSEYITGTFNKASYPVAYFFFNNPNQTGGNLYSFGIPVRPSSVITQNFIDKIEIVYSDSESNYVPPYYFEFDATKNFLKVICLNNSFQFSASRPVCFKITFKYNYTIASTSYDISYLKSTSKDYYDIYEYVTYLKQNKALYKFEYLYASDDLIKAKQEQQPLEDQVLQDFTGNGSASAKLSDASSAKEASSALKSGLNTGYSASDAFNVFDTSDDFGFFLWFSPQNKAKFDTYYIQRNLKSNYNYDFTNIVWSDSVPRTSDDYDNLYLEGMTDGKSYK